MIKRVKIDGRTFIVEFDDLGAPVRIKERKLFMPGTYIESWYNASYWSAKHHPMGKKPTTLTVRIIEAARRSDETAK